MIAIVCSKGVGIRIFTRKKRANLKNRSALNNNNIKKYYASPLGSKTPKTAEEPADVTPSAGRYINLTCTVPADESASILALISVSRSASASAITLGALELA